MGDDTVWLTQSQMAELFDKDRTVVGRHIRNIYKEEELEKDITCANFAHMGTEGDQVYEYTAYNLDVIISVGYRVKSKRGTKFRQWANRVLKEYLLRGYTMNSRLTVLEQQAAKQNAEIQSLKNKVDFFVRTSLPPQQGIFFDGQVFDAYQFASDLLCHIELIDLCNSSRNRAACRPSIWAWWNWKEMGRVVLSQPLRYRPHATKGLLKMPLY